MMKFLPNNLTSRGRRVLGSLLLTLLFLATGVTARAQQQRLIPVKFINATVQQVLSYLDEKTEYDFVYNNAQLANLPKVSIEKSATLQEILQFCLKNSNLGYQIRGNIIVIKPRAELGAQTDEAVRFSGEVKDDTGHPLPGVAVVGVGTSRGAVTGAKGEFVLTLKKQDRIDLQFSFLGMKPYTLNVMNNGKLTVRDPQAIRVSMEPDISKIDDIVVTGVVNVSKKSFTGSSTTITRDELKRVSPTNALAAVQVFDPSFRIQENSIMGSNPNSLPEMYIRGQSGIGTPELEAEDLSEYSLKNNPNLPVFMLDGYETSIQRIYDLDMDRIESYTILKDAAATAMYGSRAANGVVIITTRPPEAGRLNVDYNMTVNLTVPDLSSYNMMNGYEKIQAEKAAGVFDSDSPSSVTDKEMYYHQKLQNLERGIYTDWMSLPLRNAVNHKHSVIVSGGADNFKYEASGSYNRNNGVMKGNYREVVGFGMALQYNYKTLRFRNAADVNLTTGKESPYGSFSDFVKLNPYDAYLDERGHLVKNLPNWGTGVTPANPMYEASLGNFNTSKYREFTDNINVQWWPTRKIHFESTLALTYNVTQMDRFTDPESGTFLSTSTEKGSYYKGDSNMFTYDFTFKGYYNNTIGKHALNFVLGLNTRQENSEKASYNYAGFPAGGFTSPNYAKDMKSYTYSEELARLMGVLGFFNYSYNDIYLFDLSGRIDGSSQFGSNKKYAPFYAAGVGINVHNYGVFKNNVPWLTQFKIRGTYGMTGKVNFPSYAAQHKYQMITGDDWYATGDGAEIKYLGNPNLRWEKTIMTDLGVELTVLDGIFYFKGTYYNKDTKDLLGDLTIPTSSGFTKYKENVGRIQNRGFEFSARSRILRTKNLTVNLMGTMTHNKNTIKEISNALRAYNKKVTDLYAGGGENKPLLMYVEGASINDKYGMVSLGIDPGTGKELFLYSDGTVGYKWLAGENVAIWNTEPKLSGSFGGNLYWKGLTLDCYFLYELGGQKYNQTLVDKVEEADIARYNCDRRVLSDRWIKPGDVSRFRDISRYNEKMRPSSRFVQDYNMLRLTSLSVGYEFSRPKIEKIGLRRLKVSFNMSDVFTASSVAVERGTSSPFARTFSLSLGASF